jgi:hypothetical protein
MRVPSRSNSTASQPWLAVTKDEISAAGWSKPGPENYYSA